MVVPVKQGLQLANLIREDYSYPKISYLLNEYSYFCVLKIPITLEIFRDFDVCPRILERSFLALELQ